MIPYQVHNFRTENLWYSNDVEQKHFTVQLDQNQSNGEVIVQATSTQFRWELFKGQKLCGSQTKSVHCKQILMLRQMWDQ
jgi:hypothetical protein